VRQLFRVIDWLMALPPEMQEQFREELHTYEKEKQMPYVTSVERLAKEEGRAEGRQEGRAEGRQEGRAEGRQEGRAEGRQEGRQQGRREGLLRALELALAGRFGDEGRKLFARIKAIKDADKLEGLAQVIPTAPTVAAVRKLLR
jgi:flagellar biosynthesis/type III secretory pathway protein FliH